LVVFTRITLNLWGNARIAQSEEHEQAVDDPSHAERMECAAPAEVFCEHTADAAQGAGRYHPKGTGRTNWPQSQNLIVPISATIWIPQKNFPE
jgi:hypothetical protein